MLITIFYNGEEESILGFSLEKPQATLRNVTLRNVISH